MYCLSDGLLFSLIGALIGALVSDNFSFPERILICLYLSGDPPPRNLGAAALTISVLVGHNVR